jgi:virginiamycin B lyase
MHRVSTFLAPSLMLVCVGGLAGLLIESSGVDVAAQAGAPALSGRVAAAGGATIAGVTVSARLAGRNVTTSVFTDAQGDYYFPPMEAGRYKVWAQDQAHEAGRAEVMVRPAGVRQNFELKPLQRWENQASGDVWFAALPETTQEEKRMKEVFRLACMGCHSINYTLINPYDQKGWKNIIDVMAKVGGYGYGDPAVADKRKPNPIMTRFGESLAAYLAKVRGPGSAPLKMTPRRATGEAARAVIREYDGPEAGFGLPLYNDGSDWSKGAPDFMDEAHHHSMNATVDHDGNLWMADIFNFSFTIAKFDAKTGQSTRFSVTDTAPARPVRPGGDIGEGGRAQVAGAPANSHDIFTDDQGTVWFDMSSIGALGRIDPKIGKIEVLRPPSGERIGPFIGHDGQGAIWASTGLGDRSPVHALRYDPKTGQWKSFPNPLPQMSTYGMTGDAQGNGWWSTSTPTDGIVKADLATGKSVLITLPRATIDRSELFTRQELEFFDKEVRLDFSGQGKPGQHGIRKPNADKKNNIVWGPGWFGDLVKIDSMTNRVLKTYPYPQGGSTLNGYETAIDKDGNVWLMWTYGDVIGKFDPKTEQWTVFPLPSLGIKSHGLTATTVGGRTTIGMGYLGLGRIAKMEVRSPQEIQALSAQAPKP